MASLTSLCTCRVQAQPLPPIRELGPIINRSTPSVASIAAARELTHGTVLVNDIVSRRLYLFDSALAGLTILLDSTVGAANSYGDAPGGVIPYRGDSTLFVDPSSISILLLDPVGKVARVMAGPRLADIPFLVGGPYGTPGFDPNGRLIYRGSARRTTTRPGGNISSSPLLDFAPIVRMDLRTRNTDTVALFRIARFTVTTSRTREGGFRRTVLKNPLPVVDDWAILPDGSVAIVRGQDFHVDLVKPDGARNSLKKIPFAWRKLGDDEKAAFVDSVRNATNIVIAKLRASIAARYQGTGVGAPEPVVFEYVSPNELPDYFPPFEPNAARADPSGALWIRTTQINDGRPVYYVLGRSGVLTDRVQLPSGRVIAGFGSKGTIYLAYVDLSGGVKLERARVH